MSFSNVLEVALGLSIAYYILGLCVSSITSLILESLNKKSDYLNKYLKKLVGEDSENAISFEKLLEMPQIKALSPVNRDWSGLKGFLSNLGRLFSLQWAKVDVDLKRKPIEKIPHSNLLSSLFDLLRLNQESISSSDLNRIVEELPDSEIKTEIENIIQNGVTEVDELKNRLDLWISGFMNQARQEYTALARVWVILISFVVTIFFGLDTIEYGVDLWNNPERRAIAVAQAQASANETNQPESAGEIIEIANQLNMKIGWWALPNHWPQQGTSVGGWIWYIFLKAVGFLITTTAVAQGSSFWYDNLRRLSADQGSMPTPTSP
ncbi:MAG: hypothetical protein AAF902_17435 [Chloroflexota bacterium]